MKRIFLILACIVSSHLSRAQLKATPVCHSFTVDVLDGSVNNLYPESPPGDIATRLPCFSQIIEEPTASISATVCSGIFYKDKGISFYTYRDYIEIAENFKGTLTLPIMGADRNSLFKWLGLPREKDIAREAYQMRHGILVVYFNDAGRINKLLLSSKSVESLRPCD